MTAHVQEIQRAADSAYRTSGVAPWPQPIQGLPNRAGAKSRNTHRRWMQRYAAAAAVSDLLAALAAAVAAFLVRFDADALPPAAPVMIVFPLLWLALVQLGRGYETGELGIGSEEFRSLVRAGLLIMAGIAFVSYALRLEVSRGLVVLTVPATVLLAAAGRYAIRRRVHALRHQGRCMRSVVVVGRECAVLELVRQMRRESYYGMEVVGVCVPDPARAPLLRAEGVGAIGDLAGAAQMVRDLDADAVAVTNSSETASAFLRRLSWELEGAGVELLVAPGVTEIAGPRIHMRPFIGLPLIHVEEPQFTGPKRLVKGALDRLVSAAIILFLAPVLLATAVAVRLDSPGPAFFRQVRIGRGGREFVMWKFRTMVTDAEARRAELVARNQNADGLLFKVADDPRVTRVGRLLRRFSIDELPQLFNVLTGQMSLVGPRPPLPEEVARYDSSVRRRLLVKPGLTGLWQVSGRSDLAWEDAVRLDLRYVENWSMLLDIMILWKTAFAVVRARGAY